METGMGCAWVAAAAAAGGLEWKVEWECAGVPRLGITALDSGNCWNTGISRRLVPVSRHLTARPPRRCPVVALQAVVRRPRALLVGVDGGRVPA